MGNQGQQPQDLRAGADLALLSGLFDGFQDAVRAGGVAAVDTVRVDEDVSRALQRSAEKLVGRAHAHGRPVAGQYGGLPVISGLELEVGRSFIRRSPPIAPHTSVPSDERATIPAGIQ